MLCNCFFWYWWKLDERCCYIGNNSWNVGRGSIVKILPYLFDIFSEKLAKKMWKLSSWNVGRKRTDFRFTRQRVCTRELLFASLALCSLWVNVIRFSFQDQACHCIFFLCENLSMHCQTELPPSPFGSTTFSFSDENFRSELGVIFFLFWMCFVIGACLSRSDVKCALSSVTADWAQNTN